MRKFLFAAVMLILFMALIPFLSLGGGKPKEPLDATQNITEQPQKKTEKQTEKKVLPATEETNLPKPTSSKDTKTAALCYVSVYNPNTHKNTDIDKIKLILGILATKAPINYNDNALKALAIVINTRITYENNKKGNITINIDSNNEFYTENILKEKWGKDYNNYYDKLLNISKEASKFVIQYNKEIVCPPYFILAPSKTENSKDIFGEDLPYLTSVPSPYDALCSTYISKKTFSSEEMYSVLKKKWQDIEFDENPAELVKNIKTTGSGAVVTMTVGNKKTTGAEIKKILGIKSTCFEIVYTLNEYLVTCKGNGHGVGLSIYGANQMALQGADYTEILSHYYNNIKLAEI